MTRSTSTTCNAASQMCARRVRSSASRPPPVWTRCWTRSSRGSSRSWQRGACDVGPRLSVVIPVYNEGANIEPVLRALEASVEAPHETLIVYDFDEDDTIPVVEILEAE